MTALNQTTRLGIVNRLIEHRFSKEAAALDAKREALAAKIYDDAFPKKQRDLMASLPDGWLPMTTTVKFATAGVVEMLRLPEARRIPHEREYHVLKAYEATSAIAEAFADIKSKVAEHRKQREECRSEAIATLSSFRTTTALIKAWPEIAPFCKVESGTAPNLPSISTADLNARFNLPAKPDRSKSKAAA